MILTITTTYTPAADLGYLLHKHPRHCQSIELSFGTVHVFYPTAGDHKCTVALLLDIDPVGLVRNKNPRARKGSSPAEHYINDRSYACSSFTSVALARVFHSALNGQCQLRPELVDTLMPLHCKMAVLPCRSGEGFLRDLFEPLGYRVKTKAHPLDAKFPAWGDSPYYTVELTKTTTVSELLNHLYVLIPVLDNQKHYYIDAQEIEKLLKHGEGWLKNHPKKEIIAQRYLKFKKTYTRELMDRLDLDAAAAFSQHTPEEEMEKKLKLDHWRREAVIRVLRETTADSVIDLGCGEGKLLQLLLQEKQFEKIAGMEVSPRILEKTAKNLQAGDLTPGQREHIQLFQGSLLYRDQRCQGFAAAVLMEVIEHLEPSRLSTFERVIFEFARPGAIIITTPNQEYNVLWENLPPHRFRHSDPRKRPRIQ